MAAKIYSRVNGFNQIENEKNPETQTRTKIDRIMWCKSNLKINLGVLKGQIWGLQERICKCFLYCEIQLIALKGLQI